MRVMFLQNFWHEHIGVMCLASVLKSRGHSVSIGIGRDFPSLKKKIAGYSPDIACFSCTSGEHLWSLEVASKLKSFMKVTTVFGGPHPTYMPEIIEDVSVDYACVGEGEGPITDLVTKLESGEDTSGIQNIMSKVDGRVSKNQVRPLVEDLDIMPFPDRSIYYDHYRPIRDNPVKHFMAGRGCLFDCSYCYNHIWKELYRGKGHILRYHRPDYCVDEILNVKKRYPLGLVVFEDDTFIANRGWLMEFLEKYRNRVGVPFACNVHAAMVTDETAEALGRSGCFRVNMGVESGDEGLRHMVLNKNVTDEEIIKAAERLRRNKIKVLTNNMLGLPGETLQDAFKTVELNIRIKTDYPWCSILQPYPRTKIEGCVKGWKTDKLSAKKEFRNTFFEESVLEQPDIKEIVNLQKLFYLAVKVPALYPAIKKLVRMPLRPFYNLVFLITFAYRYMRCHRMNLFQMLIFSLGNIRLYGNMSEERPVADVRCKV